MSIPRIRLTIVLCLIFVTLARAFAQPRPHYRYPGAERSASVRLSGHDIDWLDIQAEDDHFDEIITLGQAIAKGQCVLTLPDIVSEKDCQTLLNAALEAVDQQSEPPVRGRSRFSVSDPSAFLSDIVDIVENALLRVMDYLDDEIPSVYSTLLDPSDPEQWLHYQPLNALLEKPTVPPPIYLGDLHDTIRELYQASELEWSEGEPAINVYQTNGYFGAHKDHLALTILIPLTSPTNNFEGGGTGFWAGNDNVDENPPNPPDLILKPSAGSALVFGGDVTHAGMPVANGLRSVLVCSFSTRTEASSPDRLHGLQAPPTVSANFKGTE